MAQAFRQRIYTRLEGITKATVVLNAQRVTNDELATVDGRLAQKLRSTATGLLLQIFGGTEGIATNSEVVFWGEAPSLNVSDNLTGRFFNAYGNPTMEVPKWKENTARSEALGQSF